MFMSSVLIGRMIDPVSANSSSRVVARDEQQRVVDREPDAQRRRDVQREQRRVDEARDDAQHEQRPERREQAERRDGGRDDPAEHEQQQHREDRERDQLGLREVRARLVVDLLEADREPAEAHVERAQADPPPGVERGVSAVALDVLDREVRGDHERAPVALDERAGLGPAGERVRDVADVARAAQRGGDPVDLAAHRDADEGRRAPGPLGSAPGQPRSAIEHGAIRRPEGATAFPLCATISRGAGRRPSPRARRPASSRRSRAPCPRPRRARPRARRGPRAARRSAPAAAPARPRRPPRRRS